MRGGLAAIGLALTLVAPAHAMPWCGDGLRAALDHPCPDNDWVFDPALRAAIMTYQDEWYAVPGVWQINGGWDQTGEQQEIGVYVDPPEAGCAAARIPASVDGGIPVVVVPRRMLDGLDQRSLPGVGDAGSSVNQDSASQANKENAKAAYSQVVGKYREQWDNLPGVLEVGSNCNDDSQCDYNRIEIRVQPPLLHAVQGEIPSSVDGEPITLVPSVTIPSGGGAFPPCPTSEIGVSINPHRAHRAEIDPDTGTIREYDADTGE
ncbi:MAG: hypothetical protein ACLQDV_05465 [Candidatus Binataceae bacterium]